MSENDMAKIARLTDQQMRFAPTWMALRECAAECAALRARVAKLEAALKEAEACMSIVEPRSDKAEYLRILGVVRAALKGRLGRLG